MPIYLTKENKIIKTEIKSYELEKQVIEKEIVIEEFDKDQRLDMLKRTIEEANKMIAILNKRLETAQKELFEINDLETILR